MSKNIHSKFALLILLFAVAGAANVFAQENSCALKLYNLDFRGTQIKNATATAVNMKTKRVYRSLTKEEAPLFAALPEGEYDVTVSKPGFKRTKEPYEVVCQNSGNDVLTFTMWMEKGSSKQIFRNPKFKIGSENVNPSASVENPAINSSGGQGIRLGEDKAKIAPGRKLGLIVLNTAAVSLPKPEYPAAAKAVRASGVVSIEVTIDEDGNVISANAVGGHPLLQPAAVKAARQAKFKQTLLQGKPVKVTGIIIYNFVAN
jgi:TonB family protein